MTKLAIQRYQYYEILKTLVALQRRSYTITANIGDSNRFYRMLGIKGCKRLFQMDLALTCLQARVLFIYNIQPTATANDLTMAITRFERFERTHNFHNFELPNQRPMV